MTHGQGRPMATKIVFHPLPLAAPRVGRLGYLNWLRALAFLIGLSICSISPRAQLQQPFVFSANPDNPNSVAVFTRNDLTGLLTAHPGSPFPILHSAHAMPP